MKRFALIVLVIFAIGLVGCAVPGFAPDSTPVNQTAPPSPFIIGPCRAELHARGADSLLNRYDTQLAYWATEGNPADEVLNTLSGFYSEAAGAGATLCGAGLVPTAP